MSLKDAPSRKHQPKSLDSLVRTQAELPSLPPSIANDSASAASGINIDDVGLEPPTVHVEADMSIEEIANSGKQQLPGILESPTYSVSDVQPPIVSPDAFEKSNNTSGGAGNITEPVANVQDARPTPEVIAPVSIAPQQRAVAPSQPDKLSPPASATNGAMPRSGVPILTLTAKSISNAETKLSNEIDTLLGPVSDSEPPAEFDPNSFSIGDQANVTQPKPLIVDPNSSNETADQPNTKEANRISGVEHAAWAGASPTTAAQISTVDESVVAFENPQVVEPVTDVSTDETINQPRQLTWQEQLKTSIELLNNQIQKQGGSESAALDSVRIQLMQIVAGTSNGDSFDVTGLPESQAAFWQYQLTSIQVLLNGTPDEDLTGNEAALQRRRATMAARQLELAANQLAGEASLQVSNAMFCNQVRGFGQFTAANNVFVPSQQSLIYCEIANYALRALPADSAGQDSQMAELRGQFVIVDEHNRVVHQHQYQSVQDKTRWRRKDFYMYFPVTFPQLAAGRYRLQLSIEDLVGQKFASVHPDMEFTISTVQPMGGVPQQKTASGSTTGDSVR